METVMMVHFLEDQEEVVIMDPPPLALGVLVTHQVFLQVKEIMGVMPLVMEVAEVVVLVQ
jgi:hypothetical protein